MFVFLFDVKVDSNHRIEVKGEQQKKFIEICVKIPKMKNFRIKSMKFYI